MPRCWGWLRHVPADWLFLHFSRKPAARMLRDARRQINSGVPTWLPAATEAHVRTMEDYLNRHAADR